MTGLAPDTGMHAESGRSLEPAIAGAHQERAAHPEARGLIDDFAILTKARVSLLILLVTAVGFSLGSRAAGVGTDTWGLLQTLVGTALLAAGAAAFNQVIERARDARMERTFDRPVAAGRWTVRSAVAVAVGLSVIGLAQLAILVNVLTAAIGAATLVLYVFVYTPLKPKTPLCTWVGAVPGALPPLIGWAAAADSLSAPAWSLFGILAFWQLPHFFAIAWLYREDYARGGYPMLTVVDRTGNATSRQVLGNALALVFVSLLPVALRMGGAFYFWMALCLGGVFLSLAAWFALRLSATAARSLVLGSIAYLSLLLLFLLIDGVST